MYIFRESEFSCVFHLSVRSICIFRQLPPDISRFLATGAYYQLTTACLNTQVWFSASAAAAAAAPLPLPLPPPPPPPPLLLPPLPPPPPLLPLPQLPPPTLLLLSPPPLPPPPASADAAIIHSAAAILVIRGSRRLQPPSATIVSRCCLCLCQRSPQRRKQCYCFHCRRMPNRHSPQLRLRQCGICRFWYITKNR